MKNTLDRALKFSYDIDLPHPYIKNKAPIFFQDAYQYPQPDIESSYSKDIENLPEIIKIPLDIKGLSKGKESTNYVYRNQGS